MAEKLNQVKESLNNLIVNFEPFTLIISDPSGNSYIENPYAPQLDKDITVKHFVRNEEQNILCKNFPQESAEDAENTESAEAINATTSSTVEETKNEENNGFK